MKPIVRGSLYNKVIVNQPCRLFQPIHLRDHLFVPYVYLEMKARMHYNKLERQAEIYELDHNGME